MGEEQALETDGNEEELEVIDQTAEEGDEAESEEFEFVAEGEAEPTSKPVPFAAFKQKVDKLNGKVRVEAEGKASAEQKSAMYKAELEVYKEKERQANAKEATPPNIDNFDTDEQYEKAKAKYDDDRVDRRAEKKAQTLIEESQQTAVKKETDSQFEKKLYTHYERAQELGVSDYEDTEEKAIELFGNDISKQIMANSPRSQEYMYHFGKPANAAKALYFKDLIAKNPVAGLLELGGYTLKRVSKRNQAPDPETTVDGGGGISKSVRPYLKGATFK